MSLQKRLLERRDRLSLTQDQVAKGLGVPRELISMWEKGHREPTPFQLQELSKFLGVESNYLLGKSEKQPNILLRGFQKNETIKLEIENWIDFLDRWARFVEDVLKEELPGPGKPPRALDKGTLITDSRKAPVLADEVRDFYGLGKDSLPDLYVFLDRLGILVYKASLGSVGSGNEGVSGAFYNHPKLGFCVLVNVDTSPGRQAFTLAHEFAHALYHYAKEGLISDYKNTFDDPLERFANTFAANFLVPGKELRTIVKRFQEIMGQPKINEKVALITASYFSVSYANMLVRLSNERLILENDYDEFKKYSPVEIAELIGLEPEEFRVSQNKKLPFDGYPVSVIQKVETSLRKDKCNMSQVVSLLNIKESDINSRLLKNPSKGANDQQLAEFKELPF
jgi:Zn-dependent peptidase ImmA (M78 family)/transcriptional regulator with XRE-family HTH domain